MMPTAELLVMETTRSAACPKQLSTKRNRRKGMTVSFIEACFLCQEYSMGLKLTCRYQTLKTTFFFNKTTAS